MVLFGRASFLTGVIAAQSQIMSAKVEVSPKLGGVKKKRHGHNFDFSGLKGIGWVTNRVDQTCYSFQPRKIKIVAVTFFLLRLLILLTDPKFQSLLTLSSNNSPLETPTPKKYDIFGILRT